MSKATRQSLRFTLWFTVGLVIGAALAYLLIGC